MQSPKPLFSHTLSLEVLQQWCCDNNFDAFFDQGLRPAYFQHGVRGVQGVPAMSSSESTHDNHIPQRSSHGSITPSNSSSRTHQSPLAALEHLVHQAIPTLHRERNLAQFSSSSPSKHPSLGCYPYKQAEATESQPGVIHLNQSPQPIIQIPFHLMLSPSRLLSSNPLLLDLVSSTSHHHLYGNSQLSLLQQPLPASPQATQQHQLIDHLYLTYLASIDNSTLQHAALQSVLRSPHLLDNFFANIFPQQSTSTPLLSDLDVFILSIIENCASLQFLVNHTSNPDPQPPVTTTGLPTTNSTSSPHNSHTHAVQNARAITNPSSINILPYTIALPDTYDQSVNWFWEELDLITFSSLLPAQSTAPPALPRSALHHQLRSDLLLRFFEWIRLNLVLFSTAVLRMSQTHPTPRLPSFLTLHIFHNFPTLNLPLISFSSYLYAYSTVATRSVYTPNPPQSLPFTPTSISSLHFPSPKQLAQTLSHLSTSGISSKIKPDWKLYPQPSDHPESPDSNQHILSQFSHLSTSFQSSYSSSASAPLRDALITAFLYLNNASHTTTSRLVSNSLSSVQSHLTTIYPSLSSNFSQLFPLVAQTLEVIARDKVHVYCKHNYTRFESIANLTLNLLQSPHLMPKQPPPFPNLDANFSVIELCSQLSRSTDAVQFDINSKLNASQPLLPFSDQALVPFFDLLNHSDKVAVDVQWDHISPPNTPKKAQTTHPIDESLPTQCFYSITRDPFASEQTAYPHYHSPLQHINSTSTDFESPSASEVFISYGALSNMELFMRYGFVLDNNKHDTLHLSKSFIDSTIAFTLAQRSVSQAGGVGGKAISAGKGQPNITPSRPLVSRPGPVITRPRVQNAQTHTSPPPLHATPPNTLTSASPISMPHQFQHELLSRFGLKSLLPSTSSDLHTFKLHQGGLPFDLFVYISTIILPLSPQIKTQTAAGQTTQLCNDLFNAMSSELHHNDAYLHQLYDLIVCNIVVRYVEEYYLRYCEDVINRSSLPSPLIAHFTEAKRSTSALKSQIQTARVDPVELLEAVDGWKQAVVAFLSEFITTQSHLLNQSQYWRFITITMSLNHIAMLINTLHRSLTKDKMSVE